MGPQCEDGYTKLANELLEALCRIRIPGESMQIFLTILRKTYGYGKKKDRIPLTQFSEATGMKRQNVYRAIKQLQTLNVITVEKVGSQNDSPRSQNDSFSVVTYGINKQYTTWIVEKRRQVRPVKKEAKTIHDVSQNDSKVSSKTIQSVSQNDDIKRKKERKENTKEKGSMLEICISWKAYLEMRKKIKKPMTDNALNQAIRKLEALQRLGHNPVDVLNQSVFNCWQGLFEVKQGREDDNFGWVD